MSPGDAPAFALRSPTTADTDRLLTIHSRAYEALAMASIGRWDEALRREAFTGDYAPETTRVIDTGAIAGWVRVDDLGTERFLDTLVIHPDHQGRGLGAAVTRRVMAEAEAAGTPLTLSVVRINRAAALYRRLGFQPFAEDPVRQWMGYPAVAAAAREERAMRALSRKTEPDLEALTYQDRSRNRRLQLRIL